MDNSAHLESSATHINFSDSKWIKWFARLLFFSMLVSYSPIILSDVQQTARDLMAEVRQNGEVEPAVLIPELRGNRPGWTYRSYSKLFSACTDCRFECERDDLCVTWSCFHPTMTEAAPVRSAQMQMPITCHLKSDYPPISPPFAIRNLPHGLTTSGNGIRNDICYTSGQPHHTYGKRDRVMYGSSRPDPSIQTSIFAENEEELRLFAMIADYKERTKLKPKLRMELMILSKLCTEYTEHEDIIGEGNIRQATSNWPNSSTDYARVEDNLVFDVGLGGNPRWGYGFASIEMMNVKQVNVTVRAPSNYKHYDANSFAGFIIDYQTGNGYTHRVMLGIGMLDRTRWGHAGIVSDVNPKHIEYVDLGKRSTYKLNFHQWAPPDWNGKAWFTVGIQNAGENNSIHAKANIIN